MEESRIFGGKRGQDKVVALLRDNINRVANQYGWNMVISAKLPPGDFFDAVAERIKAGCRPRAVVFSFPSPSVSQRCAIFLCHAITDAAVINGVSQCQYV